MKLGLPAVLNTKSTEGNLCEKDLSLDLGGADAAVSPALAGGLWT